MAGLCRRFCALTFTLLVLLAVTCCALGVLAVLRRVLLTARGTADTLTQDAALCRMRQTDLTSGAFVLARV
jgi:ABC-type Mn2+/Zn2+ transport system permease subunit